MNTIHNVLSALLLTTITCPALTAQGERTAALDPAAVRVQPTTDDTYPLAEQRRGETKMTMSIEAGTLRVRGGEAGGMCAVIVGFQAIEFYLPGNAKLCVLPLAILANGRFDADGEYRYSLPLDNAAAGTMAMFQAISVEEGSASFMTSNALTMVFGADEGHTEKAQAARPADDRRHAGEIGADGVIYTHDGATEKAKADDRPADDRRHAGEIGADGILYTGNGNAERAQADDRRADDRRADERRHAGEIGADGILYTHDG